MAEIKVNGKRSHDGDLRPVKKPLLEPKVEGLEPEDRDYSVYLDQGIFAEDNKKALRDQISVATPYKWGSIHGLVDEQLLRDVRAEILREIHFTKKETDIYKVFQSGDLNNLNGLDKKELQRLPNILKLRNALYSPKFRDFISYVTQAGKISANKYDMSLNIYHKSCHLLTHDDVIGSRRVSFILYLPDPDKPWKEHYGGALRLFGAHFSNIPKTDFQSKFVPQFNDYAFFEVKPGYSFHDVEEVKADKQRISIQGWFHIPQKGEEGYIPGEEERFKQQSSLQLLESNEAQQYDFPKLNRDPIEKSDVQVLGTDLLESEKKENNTDLLENFFKSSPNDLEQLRKFLNPKLLTTEEIKKLNETFLNDSMLMINGFLNDDFAGQLKQTLRHHELETEVPKFSKDVELPWKIAMPCVKRRFLYIDGKKLEPELASLQYEHENNEQTSTRQDKQSNSSAIAEEPDFSLLMKNSDHTVAQLAEVAAFLKSRAFKKYLVLVSSLVPISEQVMIRRFRPGSDFTLATNQDTNFTGTATKEDQSSAFEKINALLEGTICLTPSKGWESGEFGGYELCMAMDENDDPAIYRNSNSDDSVLLNAQAGWNTFNLILRDSSILKFIKYVSFSANGSRWDINCQWGVEGLKDDEESESWEE